MSAFIRLAGGTDAGDEPAPAVWEDDAKGAARVLRAAIEEGITKVAIIGSTPDGELYVASTGRSPEETIGFFVRGIGYLERLSLLPSADEPEDDGA